MKIYFAHPVTSYGTPIEQRVLDELRLIKFQVVNPNTPEHQENYQRLPREQAFEYFLTLARTCDACVFIPFEDGTIGSGVFKELETFFERGLKVYEFYSKVWPFVQRDLEQLRDRALTIEETREKINQLRRNE
ncbi:MAG: hypothetical protein HOO67_05475 [Candidatus Peribacteraceae bacterium]|nr:hypothetical protein [Candidatus Peribacteraceae bacterium]